MKHSFDIDEEFVLTRASLSSGASSAAPAFNADNSAGVDGRLVLPGSMPGHMVDRGSASMQTASLASHGDNGKLIRTGPVDVRAASVFPHDDDGTLIRTGPVSVVRFLFWPPRLGWPSWSHLPGH